MSKKPKSAEKASSQGAAGGSRRDRGGKDSESSDRRTPEVHRAEEIRGSAHRETVEAFVVAFILALLFRAFIAEAFVIPTGSMAPTLMGAHKDLSCSRCGQPFQVGASLERRGPETEAVVVGGVCPNCRYTNVLDLKDEPNHATFSGDRILVSKFAYTLSDPERWDVIVFKFPGNPKQNYIKRLVGLPGETITIRHGDVYARPTADDTQPNTILRKEPSTLLAMRHLVHDTQFQSPLLLEADYPSRWQPWSPGAEAPPKDSWQLRRTADGMTATLDAGDDDRMHWLRYFHHWPSPLQWQFAEDGQSLAEVDPYESRLIADFYAYDAAASVHARSVYRVPPSQLRGSRLGRLLGSGYDNGVFRPSYRSGGSLAQFSRVTFGSQNTSRNGLHWVGDLILTADVEVESESEELLLELVEAGVRYRCQFDLNDGTAVLEIIDGAEASEQRFAFTDAAGNESLSPTAATDVRAGTKHEIRFSNCDDELLLWVDGDLVEFDAPTTFDARQFRPVAANFPRYAAGHPLDAAPAAVAVKGGSATIHHLQLDRDKYYIATENQGSVNDWDMNALYELTGRRFNLGEIQEIMSDVQLWSRFGGWDARRTVSFSLEDDQYFPMGDNSPESLDARCWAGTKIRDRHLAVDEAAYRWSDKHYVPRDLLVGKALAVFWPHPWNSPVPFTPNVKRMKLIR